MEVKYRNEGFVVGRFQPAHIQHEEYILAAKKECDFLWIGLTRYDRWDEGQVGPKSHRASYSDNPFSFYERTCMLQALMDANSIPNYEYAIIPFPIDQPHLAVEFIPTHVKFFTTVCEDWNLEKIEIMKNIGYDVEVLLDRRSTKDILHGCDIRADISNGGTKWKECIRPELHKYIEYLVNN